MPLASKGIRRNAATGRDFACVDGGFEKAKAKICIGFDPFGHINKVDKKWQKGKMKVQRRIKL